VDQQQSKRVNEAAQKFAEAVRESVETVSSHSAEAQERSRQLTQSFFDSVIQELKSQAESNRGMTEELMQQTRRQQEAFQQLSQESMKSYQEFLGTMFSYYQANMEQARKRTDR
jgi:predicted nucleic acid-binding protein